MQKALQLNKRYVNVLSNFTYEAKNELNKLLITNKDFLKEYFKEKNVTPEDVKTQSETFLKAMEKVVLEKPEFIPSGENLSNFQDLAIETLLLEEENAQLLTDILFENCDINHSNEIVNKMDFQEYGEYSNFLKRCFYFFLVRSKKY